MNLGIHDTDDTLQDQYLIFKVDSHHYGVALSLTLEIAQIQHITYLPNVAPYIKGMINLRGKVVPVVDVRMKLNLPEKEPDVETCIVILTISDILVGLVVDSVSEVLTADSSHLAPPPATGLDISNQHLSSIAEIGDRVILNIDFDHFFAEDFE